MTFPVATTPLPHRAHLGYGVLWISRRTTSGDPLRDGVGRRAALDVGDAREPLDDDRGQEDKGATPLPHRDLVLLRASFLRGRHVSLAAAQHP